MSESMLAALRYNPDRAAPLVVLGLILAIYFVRVLTR